MWKSRIVDKEKEKLLLEQGFNPLIARLVAQRSITKLDSKYEELSHPHSLKGIKEASELFCKVAKNKGKIVSWSDYDADGLISSVMIYELSSIFKLDCQTFIPSRFEHGYGLNQKAVELFKLKFKIPPDLLIITDCGSNNETEIQDIKKWAPNIKVIILDHHEVDESKLSKSADVLINWHLDGSQEMCACGEVYQFIRGIRWLTKRINPIEFLSLTSLATIADVTPIIGDNRIIVKYGLKEDTLNHVVANGLLALIKKSGIYTKNLSQEDVGFRIAPRINAVGRLGKPDMAFRLLTEHNHDTAELMATNLNDHNIERKKIQKKIEKEAIETVSKNENTYRHGIAVYNPSWPIGVVGIVASRLAETFHKPTLVIGKHEEKYKGSGRSIKGVDLKQILDNCKFAFEAYGGHALAAGITVKKDYVEKINDIFNEECEKYFRINGYPEEVRYYDASLKAQALNLKNANLLLETVYPYCIQNNPEPIFLLSNAKIVNASFKEDYGTLSFKAIKDGIEAYLPFRMFHTIHGAEVNGSTADIYFTFPQNVEKGKYYSPTLNVMDLVIKNT